MTENKDQDKFQNDQQIEKKLFQAGGPGGPGRGNVKDNLEGLDFWQTTETLIRNAMRTGKTGDKLKATKLYMQWKELKKEADREKQDSLPSAQDVTRIQETIQLRREMDVRGVNRITDLHCLNCGERFFATDEVESNDY